MTKYRLKKLPNGVKRIKNNVTSISDEFTNLGMVQLKIGDRTIIIQQCNNPDWFEEIKEEKTAGEIIADSIGMWASDPKKAPRILSTFIINALRESGFEIEKKSEISTALLNVIHKIPVLDRRFVAWAIAQEFPDYLNESPEEKEKLKPINKEVVELAKYLFSRYDDAAQEKWKSLNFYTRVKLLGDAEHILKNYNKKI